MTTRKKILILSLVILSLGSVALVSYGVLSFKAVRVPTGSMANTIIPGDHLIISKRVGEIARGNLVLFQYPRDPSTQYLSRVVGMPGETIEVRDRSVFINGKELPEQKITVKPDFDFKSPVLEEISSEGSGSYRVFYFLRDDATETRIQQSHVPEGEFGTASPFRIPDDQFFVMGDNRDNSFDSRFYGAVARSLIRGKPTMIYWSQGAGPYEEKVRWERISKRVH
jgi:signal peptidase I